MGTEIINREQIATEVGREEVLLKAGALQNAIKADDHLKIIPLVVLFSSREAPDLVATYRLGVNAYVVKPVYFEEFMKTVQRLADFWAMTNELPPHKNRQGADIKDAQSTVPGKDPAHDEIPTSYPASGR